MSSQFCLCCGQPSRVSVYYIILSLFCFQFQLLIANDFNSIAVNVNAYRVILEIQKIEMVADWSEEINVAQALNVPKMNNAKRYKQLEHLNVDRCVRVCNVDQMQYALAIIMLPNVNVHLDLILAIHII